MFPWVFNWSPVVHWPLSGPVRQLIAPETDWFFGRIRPEQGDARIEQRVVEDVASYGRQIGLISELLVELAGDAELSAQGRETLDRLKGIAKQVDEVKQDEQRQRRERLKQELQALQTRDAEDFRRLLAEVSGG
jgi:gas vesicle protein